RQQRTAVRKRIALCHQDLAIRLECHHVRGSEAEDLRYSGVEVPVGIPRYRRCKEGPCLAGVPKMIVCLTVRGGEAPQLKSVHIDGRVTQVRIQCRHYDVVVRIDGDGSTTGVDSTGTRVGPEPPQAIAEGRVQAQI